MRKLTRRRLASKRSHMTTIDGPILRSLRWIGRSIDFSISSRGRFERGRRLTRTHVGAGAGQIAAADAHIVTPRDDLC